MKVLLLMTTGLSLRTWDELGQLSRELNIYARLAQKVGEVSLYTYGHASEEQYVAAHPHLSLITRLPFVPEGINLHWSARKILHLINNVLHLFFSYRSFATTDVFKTNQYPGALWGILLKWIFRKKLVVRMGYYYGHFNGLSFGERLLERFVFGQADRIFVSTELASEFITQTYRLPQEKCVPLFNSIDTHIFQPLPVRKEYDLLYVGRLDDRKNIRNLLQAIQGLNLRIRFVGKGPLKGTIQEFAHRNSEQIELTDRVNNTELPALYNACRLFVLPSFFEGNPKTLLEAMSCACAVLGTDTPGINNIITHHQNGWLSSTDAATLRSTLVSALANPVLLRERGLAARKFIQTHYALETLIQREAALLLGL